MTKFQTDVPQCWRKTDGWDLVIASDDRIDKAHNEIDGQTQTKVVEKQVRVKGWIREKKNLEIIEENQLTEIKGEKQELEIVLEIHVLKLNIPKGHLIRSKRTLELIDQQKKWMGKGRIRKDF